MCLVQYRNLSWSIMRRTCTRIVYRVYLNVLTLNTTFSHTMRHASAFIHTDQATEAYWRNLVTHFNMQLSVWFVASVTVMHSHLIYINFDYCYHWAPVTKVANERVNGWEYSPTFWCTILLTQFSCMAEFKIYFHDFTAKQFSCNTYLCFFFKKGI